MARTLLFLWYYATARLRRVWFELSPDLYRKFHLARSLPRWREFPFYRDAGAFPTFPEMSKARFLANFSSLNRFGATYEKCLETGLAQERSRDFLVAARAGYSVGLSSGTSGRRGVFLTTERERLRWAATILAHADFLPLFRRQRVAFFLRANSPLYEQAGGARRRFRFFDLARPLRDLLPEVERYAPTVLIGPPALLSAIRQAKSEALRPEVVISVADKLEKDVKRDLQAFFGRPLFEVYQATEGFLGISCRHGTLHLNEELHFFERVPGAGNEKPPAAAGDGAFEPLISDYFRSSQAIVRFRLDDVLVPQDSCACGSKRQAIREVRGRADDVLFFADESGRRVPVMPDFVRHAIQNHLAQDLDFKVVQSLGRLQIQLEKEPPAASLANASRELRAFLEERGIAPPCLDWSFDLQRGLGDKRKRVERAPPRETSAPS